MEVAEALGLGEFTKLMKASGLSSELDSDTRYTAFAPSDGAFSALPSETLEELANNKEMLRETLLLHLAAGKIVTETMKDNRKITTLDGSQELRINVAEDEEVTQQFFEHVAHYSVVARLPRVSRPQFLFVLSLGVFAIQCRCSLTRSLVSRFFRTVFSSPFLRSFSPSVQSLNLPFLLNIGVPRNHRERII